MVLKTTWRCKGCKNKCEIRILRCYFPPSGDMNGTSITCIISNLNSARFEKLYEEDVYDPD